VGVVFPTPSQATATQASAPLSTTVIYQTSAPTGAAATSPSSPDVTTFIPGTSTAGAVPAPTAQNSKGGLGVGAIVGIAIGAVAVVLLAVLVAYLLWRRRRKQPSPLSLETTAVQELGTNSRRPDVQKEFKPMTTTGVVYTPELSAEQAIYATSYEKKPFVPEVWSDPRYLSHQLSPMEPNSVNKLSPSSANTELAAVVPSEVAGLTRVTSEYGSPYHSYVEADSTHQGHIVNPPASELGNAPYKVQHELSVLPYMTSPSAVIGQFASASQELSSSPAPRLAATLSVPYTSAAAAAAVAGTDDGKVGDAELNRMKAEIEAVRAEKERVLHLQALEERERELSRKIVYRELSKGAGS
jgi:hypothetical protein